MITISMILVIGFLSCVLAYEEEIERFGSVSTELELLQTLKTFSFRLDSCLWDTSSLLEGKQSRARILVRKGILE